MHHTSLFLTCHKTINKNKNNKPKIIAPALNDGFELHDGFYSALLIQYYTEYNMERHEINDMLVFKIKYKYKLE